MRKHKGSVCINTAKMLKVCVCMCLTKDNLPTLSKVLNSLSFLGYFLDLSVPDILKALFKQTDRQTNVICTKSTNLARASQWLPGFWAHTLVTRKSPTGDSTKQRGSTISTPNSAAGLSPSYVCGCYRVHPALSSLLSPEWKCEFKYLSVLFPRLL